MNGTLAAVGIDWFAIGYIAEGVVAAILLVAIVGYAIATRERRTLRQTVPYGYPPPEWGAPPPAYRGNPYGAVPPPGYGDPRGFSGYGYPAGVSAQQPGGNCTIRIGDGANETTIEGAGLTIRLGEGNARQEKPPCALGESPTARPEYCEYLRRECPYARRGSGERSGEDFPEPLDHPGTLKRFPFD